jgi:dipeptidyl-peptidase-4
MRFILFLLAAMTAGIVPFSACAERLTLDRIHADPALSGPGVRQLKVSPDGTRVTFLRARDDNRFQFDLWEFVLRDRSTHRLIDAKALVPTETISLEEQARRERERTAGLSGILDYAWSPDGKRLLVPVAGDLFLVELANPTAARKVATGNVFDPKISPKGGYVSFVREQNLFVIDLATGAQRQLTTDGKGPIHNAEAEFVAQEEMEQTTGYYWAPDDSAIAYRRFDETPVPVVRRFEIFADRTEVTEQRYPAAGDPNVLVELMIVSPSTGVQRKVDLGPEKDIYLVRADWSANGGKLVYQRQSRDQKWLELIAVDAATLAQKTLLTETSATWISLHDDLRFLKGRDAFLWASERSGRKHLYLYDLDGRLLHAVSSGAWGIDNILAVDEKTGRVFVASNRDAVIETQVYALALDGSTADKPVRITVADGTHDAAFADNGEVFADTFSNPSTPPQVSIRNADGSMIAWLEKNEIDATHPYAKYKADLLLPEYGTIPAADGQALHYALIKPAGFDATKRYPVFFEVYGGPHFQNVQRRWGEDFSQYMAQQGYVVFRLDNRGSARRERVFTDALYKRLGAVEVADQVAGIDWLGKQGFVDARRIGVFGWSYGGFMTLRMLSAASDKIAMGVAVAPVTDWALYDTHYTEQFVGATPKSDPAAYQASGVFAHLDGMKSPLLLIHGMADDNVLFTNSTRLIDTLVNRNIRFELMTYPGAKHGISGPTAQRHLYGTIEAFFRKNIGAAAP